MRHLQVSTSRAFSTVRPLIGDGSTQNARLFTRSLIHIIWSLFHLLDRSFPDDTISLPSFFLDLSTHSPNYLKFDPSFFVPLQNPPFPHSSPFARKSENCLLLLLLLLFGWRNTARETNGGSWRRDQTEPTSTTGTGPKPTV